MIVDSRDWSIDLKYVPTRNLLRHGSFRAFHLNQAFVNVLGVLDDILGDV